MIEEVDFNMDGLISYQEFVDYMKKVLELNYFGSGLKIDAMLTSSWGSKNS
jgi:hypothetical protein